MAAVLPYTVTQHRGDDHALRLATPPSPPQSPRSACSPSNSTTEGVQRVGALNEYKNNRRKQSHPSVNREQGLINDNGSGATSFDNNDSMRDDNCDVRNNDNDDNVRADNVRADNVRATSYDNDVIMREQVTSRPSSSSSASSGHLAEVLNKSSPQAAAMFYSQFSPYHQSPAGGISHPDPRAINEEEGPYSDGEMEQGEEGEGAEVCPQCKKVFKRRVYLQRHMAREHWSMAKVFKCEKCSYETKHQSNLLVHRRTHTGERPYHCGACGQRYTQGHLLKAHIRSRHKSDMRFYNMDKRTDSIRCRRSILTVNQKNGATPLVHSNVLGGVNGIIGGTNDTENLMGRANGLFSGFMSGMGGANLANILGNNEKLDKLGYLVKTQDADFNAALFKAGKIGQINDFMNGRNSVESMFNASVSNPADLFNSFLSKSQALSQFQANKGSVTGNTDRHASRGSKEDRIKFLLQAVEAMKQRDSKDLSIQPALQSNNVQAPINGPSALPLLNLLGTANSSSSCSEMSKYVSALTASGAALRPLQLWPSSSHLSLSHSNPLFSLPPLPPSLLLSSSPSRTFLSNSSTPEPSNQRALETSECKRSLRDGLDTAQDLSVPRSVEKTHDVKLCDRDDVTLPHIDVTYENKEHDKEISHSENLVRRALDLSVPSVNQQSPNTVLSSDSSCANIPGAALKLLNSYEYENDQPVRFDLDKPQHQEQMQPDERRKKQIVGTLGDHQGCGCEHYDKLKSLRRDVLRMLRVFAPYLGSVGGETCDDTDDDRCCENDSIDKFLHEVIYSRLDDTLHVE